MKDARRDVGPAPAVGRRFDPVQSCVGVIVGLGASIGIWLLGVILGYRKEIVFGLLAVAFLLPLIVGIVLVRKPDDRRRGLGLGMLIGWLVAWAVVGALLWYSASVPWL